MKFNSSFHLYWHKYFLHLASDIFLMMKLSDETVVSLKNDLCFYSRHIFIKYSHKLYSKSYAAVQQGTNSYKEENIRKRGKEEAC